MEKVRLSREAAEMLGVSSLSESQRELQTIRDVANQYVSMRQTGDASARIMTYGQLATSLNMPVTDESIMRLLSLQQQGGVGLPQRQQVPVQGYAGPGSRSALGAGPVMRTLAPADMYVTKEAAGAILRTLMLQVKGEAEVLQRQAQPRWIFRFLLTIATLPTLRRLVDPRSI